MKKALSLTLAFLMVFALSLFGYAGKARAEVTPGQAYITGFTLSSGTVSVSGGDGYVDITIDIDQNGSAGVRAFGFRFDPADTAEKNNFYEYYYCFDSLQTGSSVAIRIPIPATLPNDEYILCSIMMGNGTVTGDGFWYAPDDSIWSNNCNIHFDEVTFQTCYAIFSDINWEAPSSTFAMPAISSVTVTGSSNTDYQAPFINSVSIDKSSYTLPATLKMTLDIDDESDLSKVTIRYKDNLESTSVTNVSGSIWEATFAMPADMPSGDYDLAMIEVTDEWGYSNWYGGSEEPGNEGKLFAYYTEKDTYELITCELDVSGCSATFTGGFEDHTAPVITSVSVRESTISAPGLLHVDMNYIEEGSGLNTVIVMWQSPDGSMAFKRVEPDDCPELITDHGSYKTLTIVYPISQYRENGKYELIGFNVSDNATNHSGYGKDSELDPDIFYHSGSDSASNVVDTGSGDFTVTNATVFDEKFSLADAGLADNIADTPNDAVILITMPPDLATGVIPADVFSALFGSERTIVVVNNDGVQWIFKGADIIEDQIKDVDITTEISSVDGAEYGYTGKLQLLVFADNGKLPGKATIRVPLEYMYWINGLTDVYELLWLNGGKLESIEKDIECEKDAFVELELDHNSTYLLRNSAANPKTADTPEYAAVVLVLAALTACTVTILHSKNKNRNAA